jgi:hypothetical protein
MRFLKMSRSENVSRTVGISPDIAANRSVYLAFGSAPSPDIREGAYAETLR